MKTIKELQKACHDNAVKHGFWEGELNNNVYVKIALFHSEISEFLEEIRTLHKDAKICGYHYTGTANNPKPCGPAIELADLAIRLFDSCEAWGVDLEEAIRIKMKYNETRPYRHGKSA
jgi:hypothetical protein